MNFDGRMRRARKDLDDGFQRRHGVADAKMVVDLLDIGRGRNGAPAACLRPKSPDEEPLRRAQRRKVERLVYVD